MMKRLLIALVFMAACSPAKNIKTSDTGAGLLNNLKRHVFFLADDKLEGRQTGTKGEQMAMEYIADEYRKIGLEPKGTEGYIQEFEIDEGKTITEDTYLKINGQKLVLNKEYFPLAFSAQKPVKGNPAVSLREAGNIWFMDVKSWLEENKSNPHFDINAEIIREAERAASKKAMALILYNGSNDADNVLFNRNDKSAATAIPVLFITKEGQEKYLKDKSASVEVDLNVAFIHKSRVARNIVGYINNGAASTVIIGAHYDHLGYGSDRNALDTGTVIHNGADDNASGTAALIELARMLKQKSPKNNNYLFISFSGEELGLHGSRYWLEHPTMKITPSYMINMDMVGRYDSSRKLHIGGYGTSPAWSGIFKTTIYPGLLVKFDSSGTGPSDHASFYRKDIPVLFFFTGTHSDYHKATDDAAKLNFNGQKEIVKYVCNIIQAADSRGKLPFTKTAEKNMGRSKRFTVSLGVIPDYSFTGTGVRIDGVSPGKLAEKIGLQPGDVLLQLGEYKFVDVMSYMTALSTFKKGDKTKLKIKRKNEEKEFDIEFE